MEEKKMLDRKVAGILCVQSTPNLAVLFINNEKYFILETTFIQNSFHQQMLPLLNL
jgi:predicted ABC-type ATPase